MHSVSRRALRGTSDEAPSGEAPTRTLHFLSGGMSGGFLFRRE